MSEYVVEEPSCDGSASWRVRESIVRCRDCKHATKNGTRCYYFMTLDCWENPVPSEVNPNGFCAWGERRDA